MADQQTARSDRWQTPLSAAAAVLAVVALIFCGVSVVGWITASNDSDVRFAASRDDVLRIGQQELVNFYSLDHKNPDASFDRLVRSSTGDLATAIKQGESTWKKQLTDGKTTTTAKVLDAVVTELDDRAGSATLAAIIQADTDSQGKTNSYRLPMQAQLTRTDQGWKLSQAGSITLGSQQ
jgi:Mce-associated membrane protein